MSGDPHREQEEEVRKEACAMSGDPHREQEEVRIGSRRRR